MARTLNPEEHALKRSEILDAAQRLIFSKGYEAMSIQDILDLLNMSKGAFYHYFSSKQDLLEAFSERMMEDGLKVLSPTLEDPTLTPIGKLERYFQSGATWKAQNKAAVTQMVRIWYADENALVRQKMLGRAVERVIPLLARLIQEGVEQGQFHTPNPQQTAHFMILMQQSLGDALAAAMLRHPPWNDPTQREADWAKIKASFAAYSDAVERLLGAAPGSIHLIDIESLKHWLD